MHQIPSRSHGGAHDGPALGQRRLVQVALHSRLLPLNAVARACCSAEYGTHAWQAEAGPRQTPQLGSPGEFRSTPLPTAAPGVAQPAGALASTVLPRQVAAQLPQVHSNSSASRLQAAELWGRRLSEWNGWWRTKRVRESCRLRCRTMSLAAWPRAPTARRSTPNQKRQGFPPRSSAAGWQA